MSKAFQRYHGVAPLPRESKDWAPKDEYRKRESLLGLVFVILAASVVIGYTWGLL